MPNPFKPSEGEPAPTGHPGTIALHGPLLLGSSPSADDNRIWMEISSLRARDLLWQPGITLPHFEACSVPVPESRNAAKAALLGKRVQLKRLTR